MFSANVSSFAGSPVDVRREEPRMDGLTFFSGSSVDMPQEFPVMLEKAEQLDYVCLHSHDFIEVVFVARGSALHSHIDLNGRTRTNCLIQGDVFSVQIGERHSYEHCRDMVLYNLFVRPEFLAQYPELRELPGWQRFFGERSCVPDTIIHFPASMRHWGRLSLDRAVAESLQKRAGSLTIMTAQILDFLVTALRGPEMTRPEVHEDRFSILQSIAMMEENPERHFTLEQLAKNSRMSVPAYTQKFRSALGMSPMKYLLKARLLHVQHYLVSTELSINEIAALSGFCSANYLIKLFHRELGITPSQFRKQRELIIKK